MISREELAKIARRYDTSMARAMCRALGVKPKRSFRAAVARVNPAALFRRRFDGWRETMRQDHGVDQNLGE